MTPDERKGIEMTELFRITPNDITTKSQFVHVLYTFVVDDGQTTPDGEAYQPSRGEIILVRAIAKYFELHTEVPEVGIG